MSIFKQYKVHFLLIGVFGIGVLFAGYQAWGTYQTMATHHHNQLTHTKAATNVKSVLGDNNPALATDNGKGSDANKAAEKAVIGLMTVLNNTTVNPVQDGVAGVYKEATPYLSSKLKNDQILATTYGGKINLKSLEPVVSSESTEKMVYVFLPVETRFTKKAYLFRYNVNSHKIDKYQIFTYHFDSRSNGGEN
jgi:hypothetical protein